MNNAESDIRLLIVDDSAVVRKMLGEIMDREPGLKVVGTVKDGSLVLPAVHELEPDVISLDIEMPVQNGLQTVTQLRAVGCQLPIIMFSTLTEAGASATLDALERGATDYVTKPSNQGSIKEVIEKIRDSLCPKIEAAVGRPLQPTGDEAENSRSTPATPKLQPVVSRLQPVRRPAPTVAPEISRQDSSREPAVAKHVAPGSLVGETPSLAEGRPQETGHEEGAMGGLSTTSKKGAPLGSPAKVAGGSSSPPASQGAPGVIAIGVSTGGPNALTAMLPNLPADFPVPILIVQHMPPVFTRLLAERLDERCHLKVREAGGGETVRAGEVWVAPGDHHMVIEGRLGALTLALNRQPPEHSCRPAVDPLFRSVARVFGRNALSLVMTGMGTDGQSGCEEIRKAGGRVWVQDEASSVVWGMPGIVSRSGLSEKTLALDGIAPELCGVVGRHSVAAVRAGS